MDRAASRFLSGGAVAKDASGKHYQHMATYRVRFRFRVSKPIHIAGPEHKLSIDGHDVVLTAQETNKNILDADWLCMNARGFESYQAAVDFGARLRTACEISSAIVRFGVDTGVDLATVGIGQIVKDHLLSQGLSVRDNVHGIDVFEDRPPVAFPLFEGTLTVRLLPEPFLSGIGAVFPAAGSLSKRTKDILILLNYALLRPEPVAQIVFAISAVEMLGQDEEWSSDQKRLLQETAAFADASSTCSNDQRLEVADAIRRSLHKLSLRQGVLRLLASHGLSHLKSRWDGLYAKRSTLVHGLAPKPGADYSELAFSAVSLCGQILLAVIANEVTGANEYVDKFYELK